MLKVWLSLLLNLNQIKEEKAYAQKIRDDLKNRNNF
jgi:hypothetical protein